MSIIKSIKQVLGLGPAAENHFWDGSVPNQLSLKRGTPEAPGATLIKTDADDVSFPQGVGSISRIGLTSTWAVPNSLTVVPLTYNLLSSGISHVSDSLVVPKKGIYIVMLAAQFDLTSDSALFGFTKNGANYPVFGGSTSSGFGMRLSGVYPITLDAGDVLRMIAARGSTSCNLINGENTWMSAMLYKELP